MHNRLSQTKEIKLKTPQTNSTHHFKCLGDPVVVIEEDVDDP